MNVRLGCPGDFTVTVNNQIQTSNMTVHINQLEPEHHTSNGAPQEEN